MDRLQTLLSGLDSTDYYKVFSHQMDYLLQQNDFLEMVTNELNKVVLENDAYKFYFITGLLFAGRDIDTGYGPLYLTMMDFVIDNYSKNNDTGNERAIEYILDLFWHRQEGLKNLDREGQLKLFRFLKITTGFKYEILEGSFDAAFFAVKKSMDLIKYQDGCGDSQLLKDMFFNHFDVWIREEAATRITD